MMSTDGIEVHHWDWEDEELIERLDDLGYKLKTLKNFFLCILCPECCKDNHNNCFNSEHYKYCSCPCELGWINKDGSLKGTEGFD